MPVKYVCRKCGYVLWEFKHVGQDCYGLPTPSEIMVFYGGICPNCKRELTKPTLNDILIMLRGSKEVRIPGYGLQPPELLVGGKASSSAYSVEAT